MQPEQMADEFGTPLLPQLTKPTRADELTETVRYADVPVIIHKSGSVQILDSEKAIPAFFAEGDSWCVSARVTIEPLRRK